MVGDTAIIYQTKNMPHTPNNIKEYVAYKMSVSHLKQHSRILKINVVYARYTSIYLMHSNGYSVGFICGHFNCERLTVKKALRKVSDSLGMTKTKDKLILAIQDAVKNYNTWANNLEAKA